MAGSHPLNTYKKMKEMTEVTNLTQIDTIFAFENSITKMWKYFIQTADTLLLCEVWAFPGFGVCGLAKLY